MPQGYYDIVAVILFLFVKPCNILYSDVNTKMWSIISKLNTHTGTHSWQYVKKRLCCRHSTCNAKIKKKKKCEDERLPYSHLYSYRMQSRDRVPNQRPNQGQVIMNITVGVTLISCCFCWFFFSFVLNDIAIVAVNILYFFFCFHCCHYKREAL